MRPLVVGLNHRSAPLEVRELLAVTSDQMGEALAALKEQLGQGVVLCTCNRSEFYTLGQDEGLEGRVRVFITDYFGIAEDEVASYLYSYQDDQCMEHLFRVASGLDSMILGESQILGQVRNAFAAATANKAVHNPLSRLFHQALRVGKRVRSETGIGRNALSVSRACVELARRMLGEVRSLRVLVIGAGDAGKLATKALRESGVSQLWVTNRTYWRAQELAEELGGEAIPFAEMEARLAEADIVVSSTGSPGYILSKNTVEEATEYRKGKPLFLIDIAVPRDIEPAVREIDNVFLYDIDDLEMVSEANRLEREKEAQKAQAIVSQEVEQFMRWWHSLNVIPTIKALRKRGEEIRSRELLRILNLLEATLSPADVKKLEAMSRAIVNKLLHHPTTLLKEHRSPSHLHLTRELFDLPEVSS